MRNYKRGILGFSIAIVLAITPLACQSVRDRAIGIVGDGGEELLTAKSRLRDNSSMLALAQDLDRLEKHIDWFGSVVAKGPDVWGEARLTKYREEFEKQMADDTSKFKVELQGSLSRSDQLYFANAFALSAAIQPKPPVIGKSGGSAKPLVPTESTTETVTEDTLASGGKQKTTTKTTEKPEAPPEAVKPLPLPDVTKLVSDVDTVIKRDSASLTKIGFGKLKEQGVGLEPTIVLEQKARYLNYLAQIRRTNEGDDIADSPGYSLNLVRIPVSLLPGRRTDQGFGAEIAMTLTPILGDDLLPATFRNLVVNDLVSHLSFPLAEFLDSEKSDKILTPENRCMIQCEGVTANIKGLKGRGLGSRFHAAVPVMSFSNSQLARDPFPASQILQVYGPEFVFEIAYGAHQALNEAITRDQYPHIPDVQMFLREELTAALKFLAEPSRQCLWLRYCTPDLATAVKSREMARLKCERESFQQDVKKLDKSVSSCNSNCGEPHCEKVEFSKTVALAWCILVDSALLVDRLRHDMKETASSRQSVLPAADHWLPYFLPDPPPEARQAFNEYVRMRWPVRVFALDPVTQDQNIADTLSTKRELQLALSIAFTNGAVSASNFMKFARRLEAEYETIAINRTQVGFSHGENTFGWRFYPRFQSPDSPGSLGGIAQTFVGGPKRDSLLKQRRMEPGTRECVALVIMPSFVPYVHLDTVANWFPLHQPKHKVLDHSQALRLSRAVKTIETCGVGVTDTCDYRDGDHTRLLRRAEQLAARLPMQTLSVQVPQLQTLGGFEMFNHGISDFAPKLIGFYGAPGIDPKMQTTLFLVGDHFSVHNTRVIIGNQEIAQREMLSRQVIKVTVPANPMPVIYEGSPPDRLKFAHIHVATPYGVSTELAVPIVTGPATPAATSPTKNGFSVATPEKFVITYRMDSDATTKIRKAILVNHQGGDYVDLVWDAPTGIGPKKANAKLRLSKDDIINLDTCVFNEKGKSQISAQQVAEKIINKLNTMTKGADLPAQVAAVFQLQPVFEAPSMTFVPREVEAAAPLIIELIVDTSCKCWQAASTEKKPSEVLPGPTPVLPVLPALPDKRP
jgi:hypothetical protein